MSFVALSVLSLLLNNPGTAVTAPDRRAAQQIPESPKFLDIDGKKNPELIPEHAVWRGCFHFLARSRKSPPGLADSVRIRELKFSETDFELFRAYADKQMAFEDQQATLYEARFKEVKTDLKALKELGDGTEMAIRVETLRLADDFLAALTPEARTNAQLWIASQKATMSVRILESALPFYLKPR